MEDLLYDLRDDGITETITHTAMQYVDKKAGWPQDIAMRFVKLAADCLHDLPKRRIDSVVCRDRLQELLSPPDQAAPPRRPVQAWGDQAASARGTGGSGGDPQADPTDEIGVKPNTPVMHPRGPGVYVEFRKSSDPQKPNVHIIALDSEGVIEVEGWQQSGCRILTAAEAEVRDADQRAGAQQAGGGGAAAAAAAPAPAAAPGANDASTIGDGLSIIENAGDRQVSPNVLPADDALPM